MRRFLAIFTAKQAAFWSRIFGRGGGGALPQEPVSASRLAEIIESAKGDLWPHLARMSIFQTLAVVFLIYLALFIEHRATG